MRLIFLLTLAFPWLTYGQAGLDVAYKNAGLATANGLDEKLELIFHFIYSDLSRRHVQTKEFNDLLTAGDFDGVKKILGEQGLENYSGTTDIYGTLDLNRKNNRAVDKEGKLVVAGCRSVALLFSNLLKKTGFPAKDIYILETVNERDLRAICRKILHSRTKSEYGRQWNTHWF